MNFATMKRRNATCPDCGGKGLTKMRGLQGGGEVMICLVLCLCGILPGIIYYILKDGQPCCAQCGCRR